MFSQLTAYGRLVRDPELRVVTAAGGSVSVCNITVACSDVSSSSGEKREYTAYFDFVFWAGQAEAIANNLKKGDPILAIGSGRTEKWEDLVTGTKRSHLCFRGKDFRFISGTKAREKPSAPEGAGYKPPPSLHSNPDTIAADIVSDMLDMPSVDDIPF